MREWCSLEEVYDSYIECRKRKRSTKSCAKFEQNEMSNVYQLYLELNTHTYEIGFSDAFCVTRPKIREVFAADFRDRIIHHLLMRKLEPLFEEVFIEDSYNCRKGKGTDYGVKRAAYFANEYSDGWVLICDLKGFFMSINKKLLWNKLKQFILHNYIGEDIDDVLWLVEKVVLHKPQNKCIKKGNLTLWNKLEKNKSLFTNNQDCGLAIGNLTSQIFANFYLLAFDLYKRDILKIQGGRYVDDDNSFSHNKELLLKALPKYRIFLKEELGIDLHPKKIYLQPVKHGFKFVGSVIKQNRIYAGNRTIDNLYSLVRYYNSQDIVGIKLEYMVQRFNSYLGYLKHRRTYAIRCKIWSMLKPELKQFVYMSADMCTMKIKIQYKLKFKLLKNYGKKRLNKRQLSGDSSGICQKRSSVLST